MQRGHMKLITITGIFLCGIGVLAQDNPGITAKVESWKYPNLARQARIQGDVRLQFRSGVPSVTSGHPLLAPNALENLKSLGDLSEAANVVYHFVLVDSTVEVTRTTVKKGDAFDRLFLRLFRIRTDRVVEETQCVSDSASAPKNRIDLTRNPVEVWIYGVVPCLQAETSYLASR